MSYASVVNGVVTGIYNTPSPGFILCGPQVQVGWLYNMGAFTPSSGQLNPTPTPPTALQIFIQQVLALLADSDHTMLRVQEGISRGTTTSTTADVVAFVNWRVALRALLASSSPTTIPTKPAYPAGT